MFTANLISFNTFISVCYPCPSCVIDLPHLKNNNKTILQAAGYANKTPTEESTSAKSTSLKHTCCLQMSRFLKDATDGGF